MNGARNHPLYGAVDNHEQQDIDGHYHDGENQMISIGTIGRSGDGAVITEDKMRRSASPSSRRVAVLSVLALFVVIAGAIIFCFDEEREYNIEKTDSEQQVSYMKQMGNQLLIDEYIRSKQETGDAKIAADADTGKHSVGHSKFLSSMFFSSKRNDDDDNGEIARFYKDQPVDHFNKHDHRTWSNRYYQTTKYFGGPGSPILLIVGGEGSLDHGILYPFVRDVLAAKFGAAVLQIEHRFYGPYRPIQPPYQNRTEELLKLLTPEQAMADMMELTNLIRYDEWGCSPDKHSPKYCPVVTVGASYPGFLSAMFRIVHPEFAEISYASSAPLLMYAQISPPESYYDVVTMAADNVSPGCAKAVRSALDTMMDTVLDAKSVTDAAHKIGVCINSDNGLPAKDVATKERLAEQVLDGIVVEFSNIDMGVYPPGPDTDMYKTCKIFQHPDLSNREKLRGFFQLLVQEEKEESMGCDFGNVDCDEVDLPLPAPESFCYNIDDEDTSNGQSNDDNTDYMDGLMWDFQTCSKVIFLAATSNYSMFPPVPASYKTLERTCRMEGFGPPVHPRPYFMIDEWDYMNKLNNTASYILFTNGMQDMWSAGSVMWNVSDTVLALNFKNGAHHSELSHSGPNENDTDDIRQGYIQVLTILGNWLDEVQAANKRSDG